MEALKRSDEKMESYSRKTDEKKKRKLLKKKKTDEKMDDFSRKADELLEKFMLVTNTVGSQIQGMNSSIVRTQEMNEKMKEEGENRYNQFNERITSVEKILDMDEKYENRSEDNKKHVGENQGKK